MYGKSVFHCPYCDGWEVRDRPLAVYGRGAAGVRLALTLRTWSSDVALCTDGPAEALTEGDAALLARRRIAVVEARIIRLEGKDGMLERIVHERGSLPRSALFLKTSPEQRSDLAAELRCAVNEDSGVEVAGKHEETYVKGVFVAGDASKDLLLAIVAAAEGADAAFGINCELQDEEIAEVSRGGR
jgi:thioredoxin reductase